MKMNLNGTDVKRMFFVAGHAGRLLQSCTVRIFRFVFYLCVCVRVASELLYLTDDRSIRSTFCLHCCFIFICNILIHARNRIADRPSSRTQCTKYMCLIIIMHFVGSFFSFSISFIHCTVFDHDVDVDIIVVVNCIHIHI